MDKIRETDKAIGPDQMINIVLKNCSFYGYHGVLQGEKEIGQRFFIDVDLSVLKSQDIDQDLLDNTVHYGEVFAIVEKTLTQNRYDLIETLAYFIGKNICDSFEKVCIARITVRKPGAPVSGIFDYVEVCVETRNK